MVMSEARCSGSLRGAALKIILLAVGVRFRKEGTTGVLAGFVPALRRFRAATNDSGLPAALNALGEIDRAALLRRLKGKQ
jgi:hypothetical protein